MKNTYNLVNKENLQGEKVSEIELEVMWALIKETYPIEERNNYYKLAELINKEFQVAVTADELVSLDSISREEEDRRLHYRLLGYY